MVLNTDKGNIKMKNQFLDHDGKPLIIGALYCCLEVSDKLDEYSDGGFDEGDLVRYVGITSVFDVHTQQMRDHKVFADADTWEEVRPIYYSLLLQNAGIVNPKLHGW